MRRLGNYKRAVKFYLKAAKEARLQAEKNDEEPTCFSSTRRKYASEMRSRADRYEREARQIARKHKIELRA